jgi:uncharacterized protein (TIGR00369 family)
MSRAEIPIPTELDEGFIQLLKKFWEENVTFNQVLGLTVESIRPDGVSASIQMRKELIGHRPTHRIHGGVISAGLDAMGGLAVMAAIAARHMDETPQQRMHRFLKLGTIDLRIDYLRPGVGERFTLTAEVLRLGSRVATTRMAFLAADGKLLSTGSAAYIVS